MFTISLSSLWYLNCLALLTNKSTKTGLHIMRHCDNATISDITGVFTSPYIFNKMRRGATGKNPIKCDTTLRMRPNSIKCDNLIFTATVSIFEDLKLLGKILQKDLNKINESAWCLHSHLLHWNQCHCQRNWHKPIII